MSEAWGTTGRVTLEGLTTGVHRVRVDGAGVGYVAAYLSKARAGMFFAVQSEPWVGFEEIPSRDAAVMWVLRRTAPDVWRAERPVVWRVDLTAGGWRTTCSGLTCDRVHRCWWTSRENALAYADSCARAEYARAAR